MNKEELSAQRAEKWREELRRSRKAKERTDIPRVKMKELDPAYRITNREEVNCGLTCYLAGRRSHRHLARHARAQHPRGAPVLERH